MDTVGAIFTQLGADLTIIYQFAVVLILFLLSKVIFLNKLQNVIETREEKTIKLENSAESTFEEVSKLEETYKAKIDSAYQKAQEILNSKKSEITREQNSLVKKNEDEVQEFIESERSKYEKELNAKKSSMTTEVEGLADSLINKMTH